MHSSLELLELIKKTESVSLMRQINYGDINRVLLKSINLYEDDNNKVFSWEFIEEELRIELNQNSRNYILSQLYGVLSYRNNKYISRIFERYSSKKNYDENGKIKSNTFNLLEIWERLAERFLLIKDNLYIEISKFEEWKKYFHALDEDLIVLNYLVRQKFLKIKPEMKHVCNYIAGMKTFITPYEPQVKKILEKGIAIQHVHLTGSYPAPYYWVAVMNNRINNKNILYFNNFNQDIRYNNTENAPLLSNLIEIAKIIRVILFEYAKRVIEDNFEIKKSSSDRLIEDFIGITKIIDNGMIIAEDRILEVNKKIYDYKYELTDYAFKINKIALSEKSEITAKSLFGERLLIFYVLYFINNKHHRDNQVLSKLLWIYIQVKNSFLCKIQQQEGISGFDYFEYTLNTITWKENGSEIINFCKEIGEYLQESKSVVRQEFMIAPQENEEKYNEIIRIIATIKKTMNEKLLPDLLELYKEVKVGVIIHFIKNEGDYLRERLNSSEDSYKIYHYSKRDENIKNYNTLIKYKISDSTTEKDKELPIVAIDTANRELYCPPEVFGEIYKRIFEENFKIEKEYQFKGKTFHVGEDFVSLGTGLRRIFEAIYYLSINSGDRLGHCIALGIDVDLWIHNNPTIEINLIDLLDDYIFEWYLITKETNCENYSRVNWLERKISEYSIKIFGAAIKPEVLVDAWLKRGSITKNDGNSYGDEESIPYWITLQGEIMQKEIRKGTHNVIPTLELLEILAQKNNIEYDKSKLKLPANEAERVLLEYLYDKHTIDKFIEIDNIDTLEEIESIKNVQETLIRLIKGKGITIESNPTSNWLIGGFERTSDIPTVQWIFNNYDLSFTINIDDPAVFGNSIENEYYLVYSNLIKGTEKHKGFSRIKALEITNELRCNGIESSFV
ncbi:MAG TPA: hypothetical protein VEB00_01745 [Clostridia bacterium]|nr:hypothetical protein [Clostridia bacterium]